MIVSVILYLPHEKKTCSKLIDSFGFKKNFLNDLKQLIDVIALLKNIAMLSIHPFIKTKLHPVAISIPSACNTKSCTFFVGLINFNKVTTSKSIV